MSIFKMVEEERGAFHGRLGNGVHFQPRTILKRMVGSDGATSLLPEAYRISRCFDEHSIINVMDKGEIINYWLNHEKDYNLMAEPLIKSLDDARLAVQHIDDGRIGWYDGPEDHPVWHTPIVVKET